MAYLAQYTREDLADALTRLAALATDGQLVMDAEAYEHATQDLDAVQCLLRALKTEVDRIRLPGVIRFHPDQMELETVYDLPEKPVAAPPPEADDTERTAAESEMEAQMASESDAAMDDVVRKAKRGRR